MYFRQEKLGMKGLCIKQSFFSFIIPYLVFSKDRACLSLRKCTRLPSRKLKHRLMAQMSIQMQMKGIAKEGEVEDADFEVVEDEK